MKIGYIFLAVIGLLIMTTRKTSISGIDFIKRQEAFRATPYNDGAGNMTIGYGHEIKFNEHFTTISSATANELLAHDIQIPEKTISEAVKVKLSQNQFDALVSFVFNEGSGSFLRSTLLRLLNQGDYTAIPEQLRRWVYERVNGVEVISRDLTKRRAAEARMWSAA